MKKTLKNQRGGGIPVLLITAVLILTVLASMAYSVRRGYEDELDDAYESIANSIFAVRNLIGFEDSLQASYESFDMQEAKIFTKVAALYFQYAGVTEKTLSDYAYKMGDCALYYYPDPASAAETGVEAAAETDGEPDGEAAGETDGETDGEAAGEISGEPAGDVLDTVITSENADEFLLEKTQMRMLKTMGALETEDYDYTAVKLSGGWLCLRWEVAGDLYGVDFQEILATCAKDLCVIENATGNVLISSSETPYDFLDEGRITFDKTHTEYEADGIQAGYYDGSMPFTGIYFEKIRLFNKYSVFVYVSLRSVLNDTLRTIAPEYGLMILCFLLIGVFAIRMRRQGENIRDAERCLPLGKRHYVNLPVMRHIGSMLTVGVVLTAVVSGYLPLLNSYASHNAKMSKNLNSLVHEMELSSEEWSKIEEIFRSLVTDRVSIIADFMDMMGSDFSRRTLMDLTSRLELVSAVVYNADGVAEMSTDGYTGYAISQNPEDDEYVLWTLLNNADISLMQEFSDGSGFFAAVRRTDAPGLVCVTLTENALKAMKEQTDTKATLLRVNTDTYAKLYTSEGSADTLLWATAASSKVREIPNNLPEDALMNRYSGTQKINGYEYYLNTMTDEDHIFISAEQNEAFTEYAKSMAMQMTVLSILLSAAGLWLTSVYPGAVEGGGSRVKLRLFQKAGKSTSPEDKELDASLKAMSGTVLRVLFAALLILYFADMIFSENPLSSYLFSHQWEREPGVFSITTILLTVSFAYLGLLVLKKAVSSLTASLNSRAETIGNLITSVLQFFVWLAVAIYSLYQVGVDTSVILTSAGVLSLIIGYGSQSIVSDLMSGIFLIMEDQVRLGEMIEVDGFTGNVTHIGLRTTSVQYFNYVKVVNNSRMAGFKNLSRDTSAAHWTIGLPVGQDVEEAKQIILNGKARFQEACEGKLTVGPIYVGMDQVYTDYVGAHYLLHFLSVCDVQNWMRVRTRSFETAYKLLTENGIKPTGGKILNT